MKVTVIVPTLHGGEPLRACLDSLDRQTFPGFEVIVVDNSAGHAAKDTGFVSPRVRILNNEENLGFGAAMNLGIAAGDSEFVAALNDDAAPHPQWLEALVCAISERYEIGMCASKVILPGAEGLDSAGMLLCGDGSSKQRGHGEAPEKFGRSEDVLLPSGSAALYRRDMLVEVGGFDESFFLYCEDTDLGLRARWGGWECRFVAGALVDHRYSHSAGRASALKAFYVERNRLFVAAKNFPASMLWRAPFIALARYFWHAVYASKGKGAAGEFASSSAGGLKSMFSIVVKAHVACFREWRSLRAKRTAIRKRITPKQFAKLTEGHSIGARRVASL